MPHLLNTASASSWSVVCLCAEWCGTCREFQPLFYQLAQNNPAELFAWIDVEDDVSGSNDLDIENFPTLLVARGEEVLFYGVLAPHIEQLQRLLQALKAAPQPTSTLSADTQRACRALLATLRA
jgi:thioredoxin 1